MSPVVFKPPPIYFLLSLRFFKSLFHIRLSYPFQVVFLIFSLFEVDFSSHGWLVLVVVVFLFFDGFKKNVLIFMSFFKSAQF